LHSLPEWFGTLYQWHEEDVSFENAVRAKFAEISFYEVG
jgi:hypothetical protein